MPRINHIIAMSLSSLTSKADKLRHEVECYETIIQHILDSGAEFYLVCYYEVAKQPWRGEWEQIHVKATVVDVFSGSKKVGDQIGFRRVLEGKYGNISHLAGGLYFVRFDKVTNPEKAKLREYQYQVNELDPQAVIRYMPEMHKVAIKSKRTKSASVTLRS